MKITIEDYPLGFPQDVKRMIIEKGFKYVGSRQTEKNIVEMAFIKKD